jgi:hypothetical protein
LGFNFGESRVLIKGTYANKPFFAFINELINWKVIIINILKDLNSEYKAA